MDIQFWIYLILAIIYLVSRALKKPEAQPKDISGRPPERQPRYEAAPAAGKPKPLTFEELLREITEGKQPRPAWETAQPEAERTNYDEQIGEEAQDLEEVNVDYTYRKQDRINEAYEKGKQEAFIRPSLEETLNLRDTDIRFGKFQVFEEKEQRNLLNEYTKAFQDPEGLKKAVVMSEILKRKF